MNTGAIPMVKAFLREIKLGQPISFMADKSVRKAFPGLVGVNQDFIPLKPGEYVLVVRMMAKGYERVEYKYRLVWPGTRGVDKITLSEVPSLHDPATRHS